MSRTHQKYCRSEQAIVLILRIVGIAALLAIPAIFFPYSWMNAIHEQLGLATLPNVPIVSYLARSLSLFYAVLGAITLLVTSDIRQYRSFVTLLGVLYIVIGAMQLGIDVDSGMPATWTIGEGPCAIAIGAMVLWLQRAARAQTDV